MAAFLSWRGSFRRERSDAFDLAGVARGSGPILIDSIAKSTWQTDGYSPRGFHNCVPRLYSTGLRVNRLTTWLSGWGASNPFVGWKRTIRVVITPFLCTYYSCLRCFRALAIRANQESPVLDLVLVVVDIVTIGLLLPLVGSILSSILI